MKTVDESYLRKALERSGFEISADQVSDFKKYMTLLLSWNQRTNLISRHDEGHIVSRHVLESLAVLLSCEMPVGVRVVDIGSGAGFPAVPIKLIRPDLDVTLVESKRFKALFLKEVVRQLQLPSLHIVCERAEVLAASDDFQNGFDVAFCRAVARLDIEYAWSRPMLKFDGRFIAWKGGDVHDEIDKLTSHYRDVAVAVVKMSEQLVDPARDKKLIIVQRKFQNEENG